VRVNDMIERTETEARRRRSAMLSAVAACVTIALFAWSFVIHSHGSDASAPIRTWLLMIGLPAIIVSAAAALQYAKTLHTGAGAAAAVLYWVLFAVFLLSAAEAFLPGALLQTAAWFVSRPSRRSGRTVTP
jgi:cytochrome bd-type quinol oxidase subunit 2